jgi:phosphotransferase system  glucose/maltose/N-acetylglucosamine-specific IIC component
MSTLEQQLRTRMFARVLGPFLVIVAATTVARASDMRTLLSDFEANTAWPWVTGAFLLLASLVVIALHQSWRGAAAITVSVVGWVLALRALFLMAFPHAFMTAANAAIGKSALWVSVDIFVGLVGLYLTYVGWRPGPSQPAAHAETSTADLPHAA